MQPDIGTRAPPKLTGQLASLTYCVLPHTRQPNKINETFHRRTEAARIAIHLVFCVCSRHSWYETGVAAQVRGSQCLQVFDFALSLLTTCAKIRIQDKTRKIAVRLDGMNLAP
jgi:hypothetical protein